MKNKLIKLSCLSLLVASSFSNAGTWYDKDGTSLIWGGYIRSNFSTMDKDISGSHIYGIGAHGYERSGRGDIHNLNYTNQYFEGKSYFSKHSYGIGYFYTRIWASNAGVAPRSLWAGIGDDRYGQLMYGFMYGALAYGEFADIALNFDARAATSVIPQPFQKRTLNTIGYNYVKGNITLYSTFSLSDGKYHVSETKDGVNGSGYKNANQFFIKYKLGDTGFNIGSGAGISQVKTPEGHYGKAWMAEADVSFSNKNWFLAQTIMYGKSITSGISGVDQTGQYIFGKYVNSDSKLGGWGTSLAKFYSGMTGIKYITGPHNFGIEWDFSRFYDFNSPENLIQNDKPLYFSKHSEQTSINQIVLTYNHIFNNHFSVGLDFIDDLIPSSSSYHQGNGVYGQLQYNW